MVAWELLRETEICGKGATGGLEVLTKLIVGEVLGWVGMELGWNH